MRRVEEIAESAEAGIGLAHGWTLHCLEPVRAAEAASFLGEPAAAVPQALAARLGKLRIFAVPYLACGGQVEYATTEPPPGERHSSLWLERLEGPDLFVSCFDGDAHDVGFELLAALADLALPRLTDEEFASYARLLERELREGSKGEIDEESLQARDSAEPDYLTVSLAATLAEYIHALWHDVETRHGPGHLAPQFLRRRFELLQEIFPPNPGQTLFR